MLKRFLCLALLLFAAAPGAGADPVTRITLATNWKAEAEHGGFYQALATGIYRRYGLDVSLRMGGPQVNNPQLLAAGVVDFNVGSSSFAALNYVKAKVPMVTVAAIFQKDPQVLLAHPGQGNDTLAALKGKPILIAPPARLTFWNFLKIRYGSTDDQAQGFTVVFVTHSVWESVYLSTRIAVFSARPGRIVAEMVVEAPAPRGAEFRESAIYLSTGHKTINALFLGLRPRNSWRGAAAPNPAWPIASWRRATP